MDMNLLDIGASAEGKMRIIQETVPGKQVTLAHIIASPGEIIYQKLGLNPELDYKQSAIGILSMCPSEISVIAGDIAMKTAPIEIGFIDRFSGTLIFTGRISVYSLHVHYSIDSNNMKCSNISVTLKIAGSLWLLFLYC